MELYTRDNLVVHCKKDRFDIYIGRGSEWGNPFIINKHGGRDEVIRRYEDIMRERLEKEPELKNKLLALKGKVLGCWCAPKKCHGDVLVKLIQELCVQNQK